MDDGELEYFCGTVARKKELTPLEVSDWTKVPAITKDKIWDVIKVIFYLIDIFKILFTFFVFLSVTLIKTFFLFNPSLI